MTLITETVTINSKNYKHIYSDKWCIQGGRIAGINNANTTITFKKAYKDTNYSFVSGQQNDSQTSDDFNENDWLYTKSNNSIVIYNSRRANGYIYWQTQGYIN